MLLGRFTVGFMFLYLAGYAFIMNAFGMYSDVLRLLHPTSCTYAHSHSSFLPEPLF